MKRVPIGPDVPRSVDAFDIAWASLVTATTRIENGPHSCTDRSWILLRRGAPRGWILVLSHSD